MFHGIKSLSDASWLGLCYYCLYVCVCMHSLVPRPSLLFSSAITILEAGKKELVKRVS